MRYSQKCGCKSFVRWTTDFGNLSQMVRFGLGARVWHPAQTGCTQSLLLPALELAACALRNCPAATISRRHRFFGGFGNHFRNPAIIVACLVVTLGKNSVRLVQINPRVSGQKNMV